MSEKQSIEKVVSEAFDRQASVFDKIYIPNAIIQYKRERVRIHATEFLNSGSSILELNCGTGEDAMYFAAKGFKVHGIDLSQQMLSIFNNKIDKKGFRDQITTEHLSYHDLSDISSKGTYDL